MKFFESVSARVITKAGDDLDAVRSIFKSLLSIDWEKEKISLDESSFTDAHEEERHLFTLLLTKQRHVNLFGKELLSQLSQDVRDDLNAELDKQIDESCHLFLRFDLDTLFKDEWQLTLDGRCLHMNLAVCAHPRRKEVAIEVVTNFLKSDS